MPRADFDGAACQQLCGVATRKREFAEALQRDHRENDGSEAHDACRSATQLAVKPGPSAVSNDRDGKPCARARSSTNRTVGDDILPKSAMTSRSWSSAP